MRCGKLPIFYLEIHGHPLRKTGEDYIFFAQTSRKWELSLVYHFLFPFLFVPFFAGVPWQMTSGTKALAFKKLKKLFAREGAL